MKENPLQYRVHATPVPTTRTRGTNYPESTALANTDRNARTTGVGYGTDNPKKKPGRTPVKRHRTSFAFTLEDWNLIERLAEHYGGRISNTDTIVRAIKEAAQREGLIE